MGEAMLDCAVCSSRKWQSFAPAGAEELRLAGATRLRCDLCNYDTYWLFAQHERRHDEDRRKQAEPPSRALSMAPPPPAQEGIVLKPPPDRQLLAKEAARIVEDRRTGEDRRAAIQRNHHRIPLRLPIRVRVSTLSLRFVEQTNTINVCRTGIFFQSPQPYTKGLLAFVTLNYSPLDPSANMEKAGTVVRVESGAPPGLNGIAIQIS